MRSRLNLVITIFLTVLTVQGCVAAWGDSYNVALVNSRSIVIEYDPAVVNLPKLLGVAQAHCDNYGDDALLDSVSSGNLGIKVNTYLCVDRQ